MINRTKKSDLGSSNNNKSKKNTITRQNLKKCNST